MEKFEKQGGIAFLLIFYSDKNQLYYMRFSEMKKFWQRAQDVGRKSFRLDELNPDYFMSWQQNFFIPYLDWIQKDLDSRD